MFDWQNRLLTLAAFVASVWRRAGVRLSVCLSRRSIAGKRQRGYRWMSVRATQSAAAASVLCCDPRNDDQDVLVINRFLKVIVVM